MTRRARSTLLRLALAVLLGAGLSVTIATGPAAAVTCPRDVFDARYYNNTTRAGTPVLDRCENAPGGEFTGSDASPAPGVVAADNFSADYNAALTFKAGAYAFSLTLGNAAGRVYVDGALIIDRSTPNTSGTFSVTRTMTAGAHAVRVTWAATTGAAQLGFAAPHLSFGAPSTNGNYFAQDSPYNQKVPAGAVVDPRSARWISDLDAAVNGVTMNSTTFTTTVYDAPAGTPTASVLVTNTNKRITIPYRITFRPTQDSDAHLSVIDDVKGCVYEFQSFDPLLRTAVAQASYHVGKGSGAHVDGPAHSGGELSYLAGMITPSDISAGVIDHALRYAIPTNSPQYVYPGTRSDGTRNGGVPEGTRLQLSPTLDLTPYHLTAFQTMVAKALQTYGGFDGDHSSAFSLYARSTDDGSTYSQPPAGLPDSLISKMRFLSPAISSPSLQMDSSTDTSCAQQG